MDELKEQIHDVGERFEDAIEAFGKTWENGTATQKGASFGKPDGSATAVVRSGRVASHLVKEGRNNDG